MHIVAVGAVPADKIPIAGVYASQHRLPGGGKGAYFPSRVLIQGPDGQWIAVPPLAVGTAQDVGVVYPVWVGFAPRAFTEKLSRDLKATPPYTLEQLQSEKVEIVHPAVSVQRQRDITPFC